MKADYIPNLFIVGAAKAGTTSIYHYLRAHPEVYMSPIKEPHFFCTDIHWQDFEPEYRKKTALDVETYFSKTPLEEKHLAYLEELDNYLKLFQEGGEYRYRGESSVSYLYSKKAAQEIYEYNPKAKIIICLREPVDRTISHYLMDLSGGLQKEKNILKALKEDYGQSDKSWGGKSHLYIDLSLYYRQVKRFLEVFPPEQVLLVQFEELKKDRKKFLMNIFSFLELQMNNAVLDELNKSHNTTLIPRNRLVSKIKQFGKYGPKALTKLMKNNLGFLFHKKNKIEISQNTKDYVKDITGKDWEKTKGFFKAK